MSKTVKIVLGIVVVLFVAGVGVYFVALRSEDKTTSVDAIQSAAATGTPSSRTTPDGTWTLKQDPDVFAGYRIEEQFASASIKKTAVGLSPAVSGSMAVKGNEITAVDVTVDTTKLKSSEDRRDAAISSRGLETKKFPTATFKLTKPVALPGPPKQGEEVSVTATGDLTLHGVTTSVDVPLSAKWNGDTITVATVGDGLPIALSDYQIDPIDMAGFVKIDDHGTLKLQLLFVPA